MRGNSVQSPIVLEKKLSKAGGAESVGFESGRSVGDRLRGSVVNALYHGASGDGVTDNTPVINSLAGRVIRFPSENGEVYNFASLPAITNFVCEFESLDSFAGATLEQLNGRVVGYDDFNPVSSRCKSIVRSKSNSNRNWGFAWGGHGVNILGDSISHGAYSRDTYRYNWTNIFKRCYNAEVGSGDYGFVNLLHQNGTGSLASKEIHRATYSAGWSYISGSACQWSISGNAYTVAGAGETVTIDVPPFQERFKLFYRGVAGGGVLEVRVNSTLVETIDTSAVINDYAVIDGILLKDDGYGSCEITLTTVDTNPVTIVGYAFENQNNSMQVNNFSTSGRRLRYCSEECIEAAIVGCDLFILALGHNDAASCESDPVYFSDVKQRIDWIVQYANLNQVNVVICDFVWGRAITSKMRSELVRASRELNACEYLPFAESFKISGEYTGDTYRINTLKAFDDGSHPSLAGHKLIGETVAKLLRLSCSSMLIALAQHDFWNPINLNASGSGLVNQFDNPELSAAWRFNGNSIILRLNLVNGSGGNIPVGTYNLWTSSNIPDGIEFDLGCVYPMSFSFAGFEPEYKSALEVRQGVAGVRIHVIAETPEVSGLFVVPIRAVSEPVYYV